MTTLYRKSTLSVLLIFVLHSALTAQQRSTDCANPTATEYLDINGVRALITNGGDLWFDGQDGRYEVTASADSPASNPAVAIFAGGLWLGAEDPGGGLKIAAQQYGRGQGNFDYYPGPLSDEGLPVEGDCSDWDRLFKVNRTTVDIFQTVYAEAVAEDNLPIPFNRIPLEVLGWPGAGNPNFEGVYGFTLPLSPQGLAPFFDVDLDGIYDPRNGDYPLFCGDQAVWGVFNDAGAPHEESGTVSPLQAEIHLLAYAIASNDSILHRTTFYDYKIINRAQEDALNLYAGHWIDSDLGCFTNDLVGSSPEHELYYVYNQNGLEPETCEGGVASYGNTAPVNIFQVVRSDVGGGNTEVEDPLMRSVTNIYRADLNPPAPGTTSPRVAVDYYSTLRGLWADGTPITRGGSGYQDGSDTTLFVFDGQEANGVPWSQCNLPPGIADIRQVYATGPYELQPGEVTGFTLAVTTIFGVDYPTDSCPDTTAIFAAAKQIKDFYDEECTPSVLVSTQTPDAPATIGLEVYPNPSPGEVRFRLPNPAGIDQLEVYDLAGRQLLVLPGRGSQLHLNLTASGLRPGVYLYRLHSTKGKTVAGRIVLQQ
ncbi:T9SS type A sorting domain-containing protein [Neolewinella agarilytica]|uniref:Por secretion system C-terminal sorting domain-containing protein n=1 Tax=Neolewinella agarilytica TaxID=478744 RepID=A0A1H9CUQ8_9BACT|nr:T9SS type A sorting domain-containing protein [Neolewinella agarilytica]SEQ04914.1 Por secretion system C-terminal sorting domain-containing protein [Neolewinella agarilytica]